MARPKKTIEKDLPPNWKKLILDNMRVGASKQEIYAELKISDDLFERFCKEEPEFSQTIKIGLKLSEAWWMKQGRIALRDKSFSPVLWYMNMKNRFGWKDKSELEVSSKPLAEILNEIESNAKRANRK